MKICTENCAASPDKMRSKSALDFTTLEPPSANTKK